MALLIACITNLYGIMHICSTYFAYTLVSVLPRYPDQLLKYKINFIHNIWFI